MRFILSVVLERTGARGKGWGVGRGVASLPESASVHTLYHVVFGQFIPSTVLFSLQISNIIDSPLSDVAFSV